MGQSGWLIFSSMMKQMPVKFFVYIISRAPYQEAMVESWIDSCATGSLRLLLANQNTSYRETLTPVWLRIDRVYPASAPSQYGRRRFLRRICRSWPEISDVGLSLDDMTGSVIALENIDNGGHHFSRTRCCWFAATAFLVTS
jgi:hypothetical protein